MDYTEEELEKIYLVRLMIGDVPQSIFYPMLGDDDIARFLKYEKWDVRRAARRAATTIAFALTGFPYRERTGDIEVWNNASLEYRKVLLLLVDGSGSFNLPSGVLPYAAGISKLDVCESNSNPDKARSPLAQITPCYQWWTRVDRYPCCDEGVNLFFTGK